MSVTVETLEKLERKITLTLPVDTIRHEVDSRLKKLSRQVKIDGFRPGKVPMNIVAQRYGYSVQYEVMNDKVGEAFQVAAVENNLRVAGQPRISEKEGAPEGQMAFDAIFEVYPEVKIGDLSQATIEKLTAEVNDEAIQKTIDILRKQRRTFAQRSLESAAAKNDRVTIDFVGKIDGEPFEGGHANDFQFVVGEGQMLKEFEDAVLGMKIGESKTFPLLFPEDYHGKDVAGKTADFMVTLKKLEVSHLPELTDELAKSLGVSDGNVEGLKADIRKNLDREVKGRLMAKNKQAVLQALVEKAELDLPQSIVQSEINRMIDVAREDLKKRGIKEADKAPIPDDIFRPQAEQRVRMGLVVSDLVRAKELQATVDQIKAQIEEMAASYEKPADVIKWYYSDPQRLAEVEAVVMEANVTQHVLSMAQVTEKLVSFDELMGQS
ncbi:MAG: trigger factor [Betaproteobacteria bacterium]|jgi:trigger factor|nr:trigger factor [Betaproteobacteria bacterium]NBY07917.1 trigger factor [Betaproteobacteria bacterium]